MRRTMVVELAGLPGVGKTTTARAIAEVLGAQYRRVHTATPRDVVRHPVLSLSSVATLSPRLGHRGAARPKLRLMRQHVAQRALAAESRQPGLVLCDGMVHRIAGYWHRDELAFERRSFAQALDTAGVVFFLDAEPTHIRSRIGSKQTLGPVNEKLAAEELSGEFWTRMIEVYEEALRSAACYRTVIRVDASPNVSKVVDAIIEYLE